MGSAPRGQTISRSSSGVTGCLTAMCFDADRLPDLLIFGHRRGHGEALIRIRYLQLRRHRASLNSWHRKTTNIFRQVGHFPTKLRPHGVTRAWAMCRRKADYGNSGCKPAIDDFEPNAPSAAFLAFRQSESLAADRHRPSLSHMASLPKRFPMKYVKPERLFLKLHPDLNEKWVQELIAADPAILGLGELVLRDKERI